MDRRGGVAGAGLGFLPLDLRGIPAILWLSALDAGPAGLSYNPGVAILLSDMNGDGLTDLVLSLDCDRNVPPNVDSCGGRAIFLNDGVRFCPTNAWVPPLERRIVMMQQLGQAGIFSTPESLALTQGLLDGTDKILKYVSAIEIPYASSGSVSPVLRDVGKRYAGEIISAAPNPSDSTTTDTSTTTAANMSDTTDTGTSSAATTNQAWNRTKAGTVGEEKRDEVPQDMPTGMKAENGRESGQATPVPAQRIMQMPPQRIWWRNPNQMMPTPQRWIPPQFFSQQRRVLVPIRRFPIR